MYNNPYGILGVSKNASLEEIKKKHRELAIKYHPDINQTAEAAEKMKQINVAYEEILKQNMLKLRILIAKTKIHIVKLNNLILIIIVKIGNIIVKTIITLLLMNI